MKETSLKFSLIHKIHNPKLENNYRFPNNFEKATIYKEDFYVRKCNLLLILLCSHLWEIVIYN